MSSNKKLLLNLIAKENPVVCSSLSKCGKWLAYADKCTTRLFQFALEEVDSGRSDLLTPIQIKKFSKESAHCLAFSPDDKYLVCALRNSTIELVKLKDSKASTINTHSLPQGDYGAVYLMSVSEKFIAVAEIRHGVHVFHLKTLEHLCTLPKTSAQPTAMAFHPENDVLIVSYSDRKIVEFDAGSQEFTKWSETLNCQWNPDWLSRTNIIRQIFYHPVQPEIIFVRDDECFVMIEKRLPLPDKSVRLFQRTPVKDTVERDTKQNAFHVTENKYLLHLDFMKDDAIVAVERSPDDLLESLPPPFKRHKFGM